jgi:hypothetical protein
MRAYRQKMKGIWVNRFLVFLILLVTRNISFAGLAILYESSSFSGVVLDDYTGKPVEGAIVHVSWTAIRRTGNEHDPDMMDICRVTAITDKHGVYVIPAWNRKMAKEWEMYGEGWLHADNPQCTISTPKNNVKAPTPAAQIQFDLNRDDKGPSVFPASHGLVVWRKNLKPPEWAISEDEVQERENPVAPGIADDVFSNSLKYYFIHENQVENGRLIDTTDFPKIGSIRPYPDLTISRIKSFSMNEEGGDIWHVIDLPENQHVKRGFSITLFQNDAKKVAEMDRKCIRSSNLLYILGDQPLAETYMKTDADSADSITIPTGPQTIYLPLRNNQDSQEISNALQKLVQSK